METSYFYSFVLPLGIFVFFLTALAYYYARKEEQARRNWKKLMNAYSKRQFEPKENMITDDYYAMKLEKALEQLSAVTEENKLGREEEDAIEACCQRKTQLIMSHSLDSLQTRLGEFDENCPKRSCSPSSRLVRSLREI
jgi:hypothetical protein